MSFSNHSCANLFRIVNYICHSLQNSNASIDWPSSNLIDSHCAYFSTSLCWNFSSNWPPRLHKHVCATVRFTWYALFLINYSLFSLRQQSDARARNRVHWHWCKSAPHKHTHITHSRTHDSLARRGLRILIKQNSTCIFLETRTDRVSGNTWLAKHEDFGFQLSSLTTSFWGCALADFLRYRCLFGFGNWIHQISRHSQSVRRQLVDR